MWTCNHYTIICYNVKYVHFYYNSLHSSERALSKFYAPIQPQEHHLHTNLDSNALKDFSVNVLTESISLFLIRHFYPEQRRDLSLV